MADKKNRCRKFSVSDKLDCLKNSRYDPPAASMFPRVVHPRTARYFAAATHTYVCRCRLKGGYVRRESSWDEGARGGRGERAEKEGRKKAFKNRLPPFVRTRRGTSLGRARSATGCVPACQAGRLGEEGERDSHAGGGGARQTWLLAPPRGDPTDGRRADDALSTAAD